MKIRTLKSALRRFGLSEAGSMSVEAAIVFPMIVWAYMATFVYFDAFNAKNAAERANYAMADMLTRQTDDMNQAKLNSLSQVFDFMTNSAEDSWMRVSSVRWSAGGGEDDEGEYVLEWSAKVNAQNLLTQADLANYIDVLPVLSNGDTVILLETMSTWSAPFRVHEFFGPFEFYDVSTSSPRFASKLTWAAPSGG